MKFAVCFICTLLVAYGSGQQLFPPPPADECVAPDDGGLGPVLRDVLDVVPLWDILDIFFEALSFEPEVINAVLYLQGESFGRIVYDVSVMDGWRHVIDYFCEELGVHIDYYLGSVGYLFDIKPNPRTGLRTPSGRRRPGLVGLIMDIWDIIPYDEIARIIIEAYETNENMRRAVAKIQGDEFRSVAEAVLVMDEFADLKDRLREVGIDADCVVCRLQEALGWLSDECQC